LIVVIMVQNPKGGGLSSSIGGPQLLGGVQKTTDFLDKSTWTLGSILLGLILLSSLSFGDGKTEPASIGQEGTPATTTAPASKKVEAPAAAPLKSAEAPADKKTEKSN
jgi:preprotein translocase subunit SecG